jgi:hypothetical protein
LNQPRSLIRAPDVESIPGSGVDSLLSTIRPHWRAKNLIARVKRLLSTDASSACQRLFNATIQDLKEKLGLARIDVIGEAARLINSPPVSRVDDLEQYSPENTIELAHRVGLLSGTEVRRLSRACDIHRDLENEDGEYEASVEDCFYVFKTCIECVLSREPIEITRPPGVRQPEISRSSVGNALSTVLPFDGDENVREIVEAISIRSREVDIDPESKRIGKTVIDMFEVGGVTQSKRDEERFWFEWRKHALPMLDRISQDVLNKFHIGYWSDPAKTPTPASYMESEGWQRKIGPRQVAVRKRTAADIAAEGAMDKWLKMKGEP